MKPSPRKPPSRGRRTDGSPKRSVNGTTCWKDLAPNSPLSVRKDARARTEPKSGDNVNGPSREHLLEVTALIERLRRLGAGFEDVAPAKRWWRPAESLLTAWNRQREAYQIVANHAQQLLENTGLKRIETAGKPFDPRLMMAIASDQSVAEKPGVVTEEIECGYLFQGALLKPAQVKVGAGH